MITPQKTNELLREILGYRSEVDENCSLLGYYAACSGMSLPTFRDNISGPIVCPETSLRNYHYRLRNNAEESRSRKDQQSIYTMHLVQRKNILCVVSSQGKMWMELVQDGDR
jgi:hypothetical protein